MLDTTKLPRSFSVSYMDTPYDFVVTNGSTESTLLLNVARASNQTRASVPNGLKIDRHSGAFEYSAELNADIDSLRPMAMRLNAIPAKLLGYAWRFVQGLLGMGPRSVIIGGGDIGLGWNLGALFVLIFILALALTIGLYVVLPLIVLAVVSFVLDLSYFKPNLEAQAKAFMSGTADQVRDLVEDTVVY